MYNARPLMGLLDEQGRLTGFLCNGKSIPLTDLFSGGADVTVPTLLSATILNAAPNKIVLAFSELLSSSVSGTATLGGPSKTIASQVVLGSNLEITVTAGYVFGNSVAVSIPNGYVRDLAGNQSPAYTSVSVTNNVAATDTTAPQFVSAAVANATPNKIVLTFSEALSATVTGTVTTSPARTVSSQTVVGSTLEVVVSTPFAYTDVITATMPSGLVRDAANNASVLYSAQPVTNSIAAPADTRAPVFVSTSIDSGTPTKIGVFFDEALSVTLTGSVTLGGPSRTVVSQTVVGSGVEIVVNTAYASGDAPTISYPLGWARDAAGNQVVARSNQAVTNNIAAPGTVPTTFNSLYAGGWEANRTTDVVTQAPRSKPAKSANIMADGYVDAAFGTRVRRVTSITDVPAAGNVQMRHEYSRRQAYNADSTKRLVQSTQSFWKIQDTTTLAYLDMGGTSPFAPGHIIGFAGDCEPIWHPTDPNKIWHTGQNGVGAVWSEYDCVTKTDSVMFDMRPHMAALGGRFTNVNACWFNGEGRPSDDGRWWAFACENYTVGTDFTSLGFCMYDRQNDVVVWSLENPRGDRPNWVSTSPDGAYAILSWYSVSAGSLAEVNQINLATGANPVAGGTTGMRGVRAYNRVTGAHHALSAHGEHSDLARNAYGVPVYVQVSFHGSADGVTDGGIFYRHIDDPSKVFNLPINTYAGSTGTGIHISGCATDRPGLVVIGKYVGVGSGPYDGQVFVAELLESDSRVYRLAHTYVSLYTYFAEPHPTPNRQLNRISFASDFGTGTDFEDYEIVLPSTAFRVPGLIAMSLTSPPTISGTATPGGTLTRVQAVFAGYPVPTLTGNWQISTNSGSSWADISGATASTYVIPGGTTNGTQFRWWNTGTQNGVTSSMTYSNVATVATLAAPVNSVAPSVATTSTDGVATVFSAGTWTGNPVPDLALTIQQNTGSWVDTAYTATGNSISQTLAAGTYRLKVVGTNTQGNATAYSGSCVVSAVPAFVQASSVASGTAPTLGSSTLAGRTLLVDIVQTYGANPPRSITSVTDSVDGTTYTPVRSQIRGSGNIRVDTYIKTTTGAGTRSAAIVLSGVGNYSASITEYRGATAVVGTSVGADGSITADGSVASGSATPPSNAIYHNVVGITANYATFSAAAGYTERARLQETGASPSMFVQDSVGSGASNPSTPLAAVPNPTEWVSQTVMIA